MKDIKTKPHLFAVYKDGVCKMYTDTESCIPPNDMLKNLIKAGYKLKMDGKIYTPPARQRKPKEESSLS